jgi:hypothetical protein
MVHYGRSVAKAALDYDRGQITREEKEKVREVVKVMLR